VEGYLDVIVLHQAGFSNTVSPMGTALNEDQLRYLKKYTRRIVLALDADAAGEKATLRGLDLARNALDHADELVFDAHGLLRHEARLEADVRVTTMPPGMDPDEVVLKDAEEWQRILDRAKPIVVHVMETLAANANIDDAKVKADIVSQVQPLIEDVPSPVERDAYRQQLARLLHLDEHTLLGTQRVRETPRRRRTRVDALPQDQQPRGEVKPENRAYSLEGHCLGLLLHQPDLLYALDRSLQQSKLDHLTSDDFDSVDHHQIAALFMKALAQDELETLPFVQQSLPDELKEQLARLLTLRHFEEEKNEDKILEDLIRSVMNLRLIRVNEALGQLRYLQQEEPESPADKQAWMTKTLEYTLLRGKLDQALARSVLTS
jgi:DNA primase